MITTTEIVMDTIDMHEGKLFSKSVMSMFLAYHVCDDILFYSFDLFLLCSAAFPQYSTCADICSLEHGHISRFRGSSSSWGFRPLFVHAFFYLRLDLRISLYL